MSRLAFASLLISSLFTQSSASKHNATQTAFQTSECGVWLGLSTLPGTGIGMFAGKNFQKGERILAFGDHIIPIIDLNRRKSNFFLWNDYTWEPNSDFEGTTKMSVRASQIASPGAGAAINSIMDFVNVDEDNSCQYTVPVHRSRDPQAGAFTYHHSRMSIAKKQISAGQEMFNHYGDHWFIGRVERIGVIPVTKDHGKADILYKNFFHKLLSRFPEKKSIMEDMWDAFVSNPSNMWQSRVFAALPPKEDYEEMRKIGLKTLKRKTMVRSEEWLKQHAVCADNFYSGPSSIPKAGRGVFSLNFRREGTVVLPVPLIHIPDRSILDMYQPKKLRDLGHKPDPSIRKQLLLNYCLGHARSTMLLSPYGPVFNVINHNQTLANVKLQWASPERSNHHPDLLQKEIPHFFNVTSSMLAMELITLRDIQPGEEILMDYGNDWENAWQNHLATWKPEEHAKNYISAHMMNIKARTDRLKTEFEQLEDPYPSNIEVYFTEHFKHSGKWKNSRKTGYDEFKFSDGVSDIASCEILRYKEVNGTLLYAAVLGQKNDTRKNVLIEDLPREAFRFGDKLYTSDAFLKNAFRHDIRIPDDIFPEAWKNRKIKG